jgi:hypothetical protein
LGLRFDFSVCRGGLPFLFLELADQVPVWLSSRFGSAVGIAELVAELFGIFFCWVTSLSPQGVGSAQERQLQSWMSFWTSYPYLLL